MGEVNGSWNEKHGNSVHTNNTSNLTILTMSTQKHVLELHTPILANYIKKDHILTL